MPVPAGTGAGYGPGLPSIRPAWGPGRTAAVPVPGTEGEEVGDGDRAVGGDHVVERRGRGADDHRRREFRKPARHGEVEGQQAVLDQHHGDGRGHRLGDRGDPEEGAAGHGGGAGRVEGADGRDLHVFAVGDEAHGAGQGSVTRTGLEKTAQVAHGPPSRTCGCS